MRRRTCLIMVIIFIALSTSLAVWLSQTDRVILTAKPGETVSAFKIPAISAHKASLGGIESKIYRNTGQVEFRGYLCKGGLIMERLDDSAQNNDVTVKNECSETVTIEIWWYRFRMLNPFIAS